MIIRILGEGQFEVPDDAVDGLNVQDDAVEAAVEAGDQAAFEPALAALLAAVRAAGTPHTGDDYVESDLILPMADATIDEVRDMLAEDGLIPG